MYDELIDEFLPWFLIMEKYEFTCLRCDGIIDKEDLSARYDNSENVVECPYCNIVSKKDDMK